MSADKARKVAVLGTAPSYASAPLNDLEWEIWGTGGAILDKCPRISRWFEVHDTVIGRKRNKAFAEFMDRLEERAGQDGFKVWALYPDNIRNSEIYPRADVEGRFGSTFMTSSAAWMLALAIYEGVSEIGLWGIDMADDDEWGYQRAGCLHFIDIARMSGIKVKIHPSSKLLLVPKPYPDHYYDPLTIEVREKIEKLTKDIDHLDEQTAALKEARTTRQGELNALQSVLKCLAPM